MTGTSHMVLGAAVGILLQSKAPHFDVIAVGATVLGSLAPDLDHANSKISHKLPALAWWVSRLFGHRKLLHSPLFVVVLWILCHKSLYGMAFLYGYVTHLGQDFLTKGGIPLFYPYKKRFALPLVKTAGMLEFILTGAMVYLAFLAF